MDRLISEKQIIDTIKTWATPLQISNTESTQDFWVEDVCRLIKAIPSAEPKTGHWIEHKVPYDVDGTYYCFCSECGSDAHEQTDFCPHCGARMVEPQESEG